MSMWLDTLEKMKTAYLAKENTLISKSDYLLVLGIFDQLHQQGMITPSQEDAIRRRLPADSWRGVEGRREDVFPDWSGRLQDVREFLESYEIYGAQGAYLIEALIFLLGELPATEADAIFQAHAGMLSRILVAI